MEIIESPHSAYDTHAPFGGVHPIDESNKPHRKMHSPNLPKPSKSQKSGLSSITPVKGLSLEWSSRQSQKLSPSPTQDLPRLPDYQPWKLRDPPGGQSDTPTSLGERRYMSSTDSGVDLPKLLESPFSVWPTKINPKIRSMYNGGRREMEETSEFAINPDPVPYQPSNFMSHRYDRLEYPESSTVSSTVIKKVPVSRRHLESFGGTDIGSGSSRGVILRTDRYQWDLARAFDGLNQRERLQAELEYMERLRGIKRRKEVLPHRAQLDLLMGGKRVDFAERFDIQREIQKLRSLILPQNARDLFHGRGFTLPDYHNSIKPRHLLPLDIDNEDLQDERCIPGLVTDAENFRVAKGAPITPRNANPFTYDDEDTFTPFVTRQNTVMSPYNRSGSRSPLMPYSPRRQRHWDRSPDSQEALFYPSSRGLILSPRCYGSSQPAYMRRSKTHVVPQKPGGRSLTAVAPTKKEEGKRPAATAPTVKIPISQRDEPERSDLYAAPKPTPIIESNTIDESSEPDLTLEEWPELEEDDVELDIINDDRHFPPSRHAPRSSASPMKAPTPNPLKGSELPGVLSQEEQKKLKMTFQKLDTDKDGHIMFTQLQTQLPKHFSTAQERFIKQVYDITSSSTFFGVDEFMTMSFLTNCVTSLSGDALEAYNKLDYTSLNDTIVQYVHLFQSIDRNHRGKISLDDLKNILGRALSTDLGTNPQRWGKIVDVISPSENGLISKIEFLAHLPYFEMLKDK